MDDENLTEMPPQLLSVSCNATCCEYSDNVVICFSDFNYTDKNNLTYIEPWELGVRWTFASLMMLVAVLGNLSIIIILAKNRLLLRTSVNHFILNMSVADLITGLAGPIPFTIRDTSDFWHLGEAWCYLEGYIQMLVMLVSVTSLATISCDRMIGVVRPFHNHLKKSYSLTIIIIIWVSSAVLAVPWAVYRVYTVHIWQDMTQAICNESEDLQIWWIISVIGLAWLPLSVMVVCYATILVYFNHRRVKHPAFRCEHPVITHLKKRVVKMMFAVVVIFIVCWLPFTLLQITYSSFLDENGQFKDEATKQNYNDLLTLGQYMIYVNAALNPIIYGLLHQTFRRAFRVTFPCVFKRKSSLVLTRGQGLTRYMWSVKSTTGGQQPSVRTRGGSSSSIQPNIQRELTFDPPQDPTSATSQDPTPATPQDPTPATSQDPTPVTLQDSTPATSQDCTTAFSRQESTTTGGPHDSTFSSLHDPTIASPHAHTPSSTPPATTTQQPNKRKKKKKIVCFTKDLPGGRVAAKYDKRENARCYSLKSICPCGDRKKKLSRARSNSHQDETEQPVRDVGVGSVGVGGERRTTEGIPWRRKEYHKEGDPCRKGGFSNEGYVRDLPPPKFSIVSKGALGDLIKQVIVEETSSDVEHERIL